jgi:NDP-sugar pyrophosphorylase family protein
LYPVVILAGGLATRLGPLTHNLPKCLVDVNGQPFMTYQLRLLHDQGVRRVVLCVGHLGERVVETIGDGAEFDLTVEYAFDGPSLGGTAGAIKRALPRLPDAFFVLYGDSYLECDYAAVQEAFEPVGKLALMTVFNNRQRWDASNVEYSSGRILAYDKVNRTDRMQHVDYGLGIFDRRAFGVVPDDHPCDLAAVYQEMLQRDQLLAYEVSSRFYEIGSQSGLEETRRYLAARPSQGTCRV